MVSARVKFLLWRDTGYGVFCLVSDVEVSDAELHGEGSKGMVHCRSFRTFKHEFQLEDATSFVQDGLQVRCGEGKERWEGGLVMEGEFSLTHNQVHHLSGHFLQCRTKFLLEIIVTTTRYYVQTTFW